MTDAAQQRVNMVDNQIRPSDITDRRIIRAMSDVARETFVPPHLKWLAYADSDIPLAAPGRALLAPRVFAKLLQFAEVGDEATVLIVGAATGYSAAVLARFGGNVVALESDPGLHAQANEALASASDAGNGAENVRLVLGPLQEGCATSGPYDVILIEGAVREVPQKLLGQLKDGGRLVALLLGRAGSPGTLWRRSGRSFGTVTGFDATGPQLSEFSIASEFSL